MEMQLSWWQYIVIILGICAAAILVGGAVGYLILRAQNRPWPFPWPFAKKVYNFPVVNTPAVNPGPVVTPIHKAEKAASERIEQNVYRYSRVDSSSPPLTQTLDPHKSALLKEIEANFLIASSAKEGNMTSFRTEILDADRSKLVLLLPEVQEGLIEAYTDMRLANTLVWLSKDVGRKNNEMDMGYVKLCIKVAERLEKIMPSIRNSGI
jgi:hypothetical protein